MRDKPKPDVDGITCLDLRWRGPKARYRFCCEHGHEWSKLGADQMRQPRCPQCTRRDEGAGARPEVAPGVVWLGPPWQGARHRYWFRCALGHDWSRLGSELRDTPGCATCGRLEKGHRTLFGKLLEQSAAVGVTWLDTAWRGTAQHYRFRCEQGHEWSRSAAQQRVEPRCPKCASATIGLALQRPERLDELHALARERGGQCLSDTFAGSSAPYPFRCAAGHAWKASIAKIRAGSWCQRCHARAAGEAQLLHDGLARLQRRAAERGGRCLSPEYTGLAAHYRFRCVKGHEWETQGGKVLKGSWCRRCAFDAKRLTLEDARDAARARGGECMSPCYTNAHTRMQWRCDRGHEWMATLSNIRNSGHWCRQCDAMSRISNRNSSARRRYDDAGRHLLDGVPLKTTTRPGGGRVG